jgi:hypothetical protein
MTTDELFKTAEEFAKQASRQPGTTEIHYEYLLALIAAALTDVADRLERLEQKFPKP